MDIYRAQMLTETGSRTARIRADEFRETKPGKTISRRIARRKLRARINLEWEGDEA